MGKLREKFIKYTPITINKNTKTHKDKSDKEKKYIYYEVVCIVQLAKKSYRETGNGKTRKAACLYCASKEGMKHLHIVLCGNNPIGQLLGRIIYFSYCYRVNRPDGAKMHCIINKNYAFKSDSATPCSPVPIWLSPLKTIDFKGFFNLSKIVSKFV